MATSPLEPIWCNLDTHTRTHQDTAYHCSSVRRVFRARGGHFDIWVDQHDGDGETPDVVIGIVGDPDLKALDARQLARVLLAAADIADGVAAGW